MTIQLTKGSQELFIGLVEEAGDWSGEPLLVLTAAERGHLTDLKVKGLVKTYADRAYGNVFASFTDLGREVARSLGWEWDAEDLYFEKVEA